MEAVIGRAQSAQEFREFHKLLLEYEQDLPADLRHGTVPPLEEIERTYGVDNAAFLARFADEYGGCVGVRVSDAATPVLQRLYVRPSHRGRGAARALAAQAIAFARACGYERIVLDTDAERLSSAYALYRSLGFTECEPYARVDYQCPTFMELRLR